MADISGDFQLIEDTSSLDVSKLPSGHATFVKNLETLSGDFVVKVFKEDERFDKKQKDRWLARQYKAKKISDEIREKNNPAYFIPKTFISQDGIVREQFASGQRFRDIYGTLSSEDRVWVQKALAEFINDMSELRPLRYESDDCVIGALMTIKDSRALKQVLDKLDEKNVSLKNKRLVQGIYDYLASVPELRMAVYGHNDFHGDNIIVDLEKKQVAIIDFEIVGYRCLFDWMYRGMFDAPFIWGCVNKLPRATNPDLRWNFVLEHRDIYTFLVWFYHEVILDSENLESKKDEIEKKCKKAGYSFARLKLNSKEFVEKHKMLPVPMSHYEKR